MSVFGLIVTRGHFLDYLLEHPNVSPVWQRYINHPFVLGLGNGDLPLKSFKGYLVQDYLYLVHFVRANALASYKAKNMEDIAAVGDRPTDSIAGIDANIASRAHGWYRISTPRCNCTLITAKNSDYQKTR